MLASCRRLQLAGLHAVEAPCPGVYVRTGFYECQLWLLNQRVPLSVRWLWSRCTSWHEPALVGWCCSGTTGWRQQRLAPACTQGGGMVAVGCFVLDWRVKQPRLRLRNSSVQLNSHDARLCREFVLNIFMAQPDSCCQAVWARSSASHPGAPCACLRVIVCVCVCACELRKFLLGPCV